MTLQLVTGPTNASKAGVVLGLVRRWMAEGRRPFLVVPTGPDAEGYRRELLRIGGGVAIGVDVGPFASLADAARRASGEPRPTLGPIHRDRLIAAALAEVAPGRPLGGTSHRPGVRRRLDGLLEELASRGFTAAALCDDLAELDPAEHGVDRMLVEDLRTVLGAVAASAARAVDAHDRPLPSPGSQARTVRNRLAGDGGLWQARPVACYGFDDLTSPQLALLRTLSGIADVVISVPFEDGRTATAARRPIVDELRAIAAAIPDDAPGRTGLLPLRAGSPVLEGARIVRVDDHEVALAPSEIAGGRGRLERRLFESTARLPAGVDGAAPAAALADEQASAPPVVDDVVLVRGGDGRSEAEALADELRRVVRERDLRWHDVAIGVREADGPAGARIERELTGRGIPVARPREVPARRTAVGRAVAALARIAVDAATAADVVLVLRAGAAATTIDPVDRLAIELRREGVSDAATARERARSQEILLDGLALLEGVTVEGPPYDAARLCAELREAVGILADGLAARTSVPARDDERRAARRIDEHLRQVAALPVELLPGAAELAAELAELPVPAGEPPGAGRVEIAAPAALRGRQVAVLALADLRESAFPAPEPIDPLIDRDARAVLAAAGRVTLDVPVDRLAAERTLFLELVARPTERLLLSRPVSTPAGETAPGAPFLDDVDAALAPARPREVFRGASEVRRPDRRSLAPAAPFGAALDDAGRETVRRVLLERSRFTVREVERLARCPVCWLVEHLAAAADDQPISEPQIHGQLVHDVFDAVLAETAGDGTAYGDLDPEALLASAARAIERRGPAAVAGLPEHRGRVLLRRVASGVEAVLSVLPERFAAARLRATEVPFDETTGEPSDPGAGPAPDAIIGLPFDAATGLPFDETTGLPADAGGEESFGGTAGLPFDAATRPAAISLGPIDLGDGAFAVGRIDRIDSVELPDGRTGIGVVDYKLGAGGAVGHGRWAATATLQAALYLYAATIGSDGGLPAYALYQPAAPLSGIDPGAHRPAGVEVGGALDGRAKGPDDPEQVAAIIAAVHAQAVAAVASLRAGSVTPLPETSVHGSEQQCDHPAIARLLA